MRGGSNGGFDFGGLGHLGHLLDGHKNAEFFTGGAGGDKIDIPVFGVAKGGLHGGVLGVLVGGKFLHSVLEVEFGVRGENDSLAAFCCQIGADAINASVRDPPLEVLFRGVDRFFFGWLGHGSYL